MMMRIWMRAVAARPLYYTPLHPQGKAKGLWLEEVGCGVAGSTPILIVIGYSDSPLRIVRIK